MFSPVTVSYLLTEASTLTAGGLPALGAAWGQASTSIRSSYPVAYPAVGLLTLAGGVEQAMPVTGLDEAISPPALFPAPSARLEADDLSWLRTLLAHDLDWYKSQGMKVLRPVIYLIVASDVGAPGWHHGMTDLLDSAFAYRPNIVAFSTGIGAIAFNSALNPTAHFAADHGVPTEQATANAIHAALDIICHTANTGAVAVNKASGFGLV